MQNEPYRPEPSGQATAEQELLASLRSALIGGRWVIFIAELAAAALRFERLQQSLPAGIALGVLVAYNIAALAALSRLPPRQFPVRLFLALDVATVGLLTALTGGIGSPFAGLFFLVTLAGAVYYDLAGGLIVAAVASAIILASSAFALGVWEEIARGEARTQLIPYLILTGVSAGYLVNNLKRLHQRRIEVEARLRRAEYEEQLRRREAAIARQVQRAAFTEPVEHTRYQVAVRFEPAREVGGDFYSFFTRGTRLGVVIGDVSGKGMPAALVSTSLGHMARWLRPIEKPDDFLAAINRDLLEQPLEDTFASMIFALLDPETNRLLIYNAGHPPPLLKIGGELRRGAKQNLLLGILPEVRFEPEAFDFRSGDALILYSDGFIEARDSSGQELTLEGMEALVRLHAELPPEEMATHLVADTRAFGAVTDDLTLVVLRAR